MADDFVQVAPDSTGKKIDNTTVTTGAGSVERQRVSLGDAVANTSATIKAASTPIAATDQPLAVGLHPTSPLPTGSNVIGHVIADTGSTTAVTGNVAVTSAGLTNLDVALSTRTKPADQQHAIIDSGTVTAVTSVTNPVTVTPPTLTKGTQGATGFSTQDLADAGRNVTNYFHAAPIITTVAEVMQTLTGYKSGAAVAATATPAVVTAGKTYRITRVTVTYWAATVIGGAILRLRANLTGVGVVGSPLVVAWAVGMPAVFTAGAAMTYTFDYPGGLEFAAGTGIALGVIGAGAVPTTGTITGYVMAALEGYEY